MRPGRAIKALAEPGTALPVTSLIDITFLLLIFFLLTMRFRAPEGHLGALLPPERGLSISGPAITEDLVIALRVSADERPKAASDRRVTLMRGRPAEALGTLQAGENEAAAECRPAALLDDLISWIQRIRQRAPDVRIRFDVDADTPHACAVAVLDALAAGGFHDVAFGGMPRGFAASVLAGKVPK